MIFHTEKRIHLPFFMAFIMFYVVNARKNQLFTRFSGLNPLSESNLLLFYRSLMFQELGVTAGRNASKSQLCLLFDFFLFFLGYRPILGHFLPVLCNQNKFNSIHIYENKTFITGSLLCDDCPECLQ